MKKPRLEGWLPAIGELVRIHGGELVFKVLKIEGDMVVCKSSKDGTFTCSAPALEPASLLLA